MAASSHTAKVALFVVSNVHERGLGRGKKCERVLYASLVNDDVRQQSGYVIPRVL